MDRTYVDVHVLQTVPPSNLNRDDAGSPKQAMYGGARRARVSSQAWKRATRVAFAEQVPTDRLGTRTKKIAALLTERLAERTGLDEEQAARIAADLLAPLGIKKSQRKEAETAYLLFFGRSQLDRLVDLVADRAAELADLDDKQLTAAVKDLPVKERLDAGHPLDVALFGRMVADIPGLNVDAATQVAHAISTHPVDIEFDYYTAVDDENPREETGAGMIGTVEFNAATLYRFATVGLHQLVENLGGDVDATVDALRVFLTAFTRSMPTGHANSFAHRTLPDLVSVMVRDDQPVNLVSAFESPVRPTAGTTGLAARSAARLAEEARRTGALWASEPLVVASTYAPSRNGHGNGGDDGDDGPLLDAFGEPLPFPDLVTRVVDAARRRLTDGAAR